MNYIEIAGYPYSKFTKPDDRHSDGVAIFSKYPLKLKETYGKVGIWVDIHVSDNINIQLFALYLNPIVEDFHRKVALKVEERVRHIQMSFQ